MNIRSSSIGHLPSTARNFDEHANSYRESCLRARGKNTAPRFVRGYRAEIKYFLGGRERVRERARAKFIGFPWPASANFAAVALFSGRSALLKLFARKLPAISSWTVGAGGKKATRGGEREKNRVDRWK